MQADPRSPEHGQYGFLQDLMRRVAYETLSMRERRARHLAAAAHLESTVDDDDELVEVLAAHYLDAFEADPDAEDAAEVRSRAQALFVRAAWRARVAGCHRRGLALLHPGGRDRPTTTLEQAVLLDQAGYMATGPAGRRTAQDALRARDRDLRAARRHPRRGPRDRRPGLLDWSAAAEHGRRSSGWRRRSSVIGDDEPDGDVALLTVRLGNALLFIGELDRGGELIERALDMGEALGLPEILVCGWSGKGVWWPRPPPRGRDAAAGGRRPGARAGLLDRASVSFGNLSDQSFQYDRYAAALVHLDRVREIAQQAGDRPNEWFAYSERTYAALPARPLGRGAGGVRGAAGGAAVDRLHAAQPDHLRDRDPHPPRRSRRGPPDTGAV